MNNWFVPKVGVKTANTNYTTTTLTADPDLQASLAANATYELRSTLIYMAAAATDVGMDQGFYGPSGASLAVSGFSAIVNGATPGPIVNNNILSSGELHTPAGASVIQGATWTGTVTMGSTAGTFGHQFKEHTASNQVTAVAGSVLTLTRIS